MQRSGVVQQCGSQQLCFMMHVPGALGPRLVLTEQRVKMSKYNAEKCPTSMTSNMLLRLIARAHGTDT